VTWVSTHLSGSYTCGCLGQFYCLSGDAHTVADLVGRLWYRAEGLLHVSCLPWVGRWAEACSSPGDCKDRKHDCVAFVSCLLTPHWPVSDLAKPQVREWGNIFFPWRHGRLQSLIAIVLDIGRAGIWSHLCNLPALLNSQPQSGWLHFSPSFPLVPDLCVCVCVYYIVLTTFFFCGS
jgi:hypothetical protein